MPGLVTVGKCNCQPICCNMTNDKHNNETRSEKCYFFVEVIGCGCYLDDDDVDDGGDDDVDDDLLVGLLERAAALQTPKSLHSHICGFKVKFHEYGNPQSLETKAQS